MAKKMSANKPAAKDKPKKKSKNVVIPKGAVNMIGGFSVLRLTGMLAIRNVYFTKEELLKINAKLNKIRKPKK